MEQRECVEWRVRGVEWWVKGANKTYIIVSVRSQFRIKVHCYPGKKIVHPALFILME